MMVKEWEAVEKLLINSSEGKEKNLFGQYSSLVIKDVRLLIAMYKKENLYLAEIGKGVTHQVQFEM